MRRRLVKIVTGLSFVLGAVTVALWILSDLMPFQWEWTATHGPEDSAWSRGQLCVGQGRIGYIAWIPQAKAGLRYLKARHRFHRMTINEFSYEHTFRFNPWTTGQLSVPAPVNAEDLWWRGIQYSQFTIDHITMRQVWLPFWLIAASLFMLPLLRTTLWLRQWVRASHCRRQGRCTSCGYDLIGNTSGTCPECGIKIQSASGRIASA